MYRLIQQALPPQYPTLQLPNGDVVILLDNMTTAFYENKIRAIATHVLGAGADREIQFMRQSLREKQNRLLSLENIILKTAPELLGQSDSEGLYEYRRA